MYVASLYEGCIPQSPFYLPKESQSCLRSFGRNLDNSSSFGDGQSSLFHALPIEQQQGRALVGVEGSGGGTGLVKRDKRSGKAVCLILSLELLKSLQT